jgi:chemotaxis signal transduction protein
MKDQYIIFSIAGTAYALPSTQVAHIEMVDQVTRVPNAPPFVDGVVFSRGEVVPALNLRARFGFERLPYDTRTRLIVVQTSGRKVGLVVDAAREFLAIPETAIAPPGEGLARLSGEYLYGIATIGDRLIVILALVPLLEADHAAIVALSGSAASHPQEIR